MTELTMLFFSKMWKFWWFCWINSLTFAWEEADGPGQPVRIFGLSETVDV